MNVLKKFGLSLISAAMSFGVVAIAANNYKSSFVKGEITTYQLNLNSTNKVTSDGNKVMTSPTGGQVTFTYSNVAGTTSGHVTLNTDGTLKNKDVIHSITAFNAIYTGSLKVRTSYDANTWSNYFDIVSNHEYGLGSNPYYIEFKAINGASTISSINFKYSCLVNEDIPVGGGEYTKVTKASDLVVGSNVVITNTDATYAMSKTQATNNRSAVSISHVGNTITVNSNVAEFTLMNGKETNTYAFKDSSGYIYAASSSSNHLRTETTLSNESSFSLSINGSAVLTAKAQGSNSHNWIQFNPNNGSPIFSCYEKAQQGISIYQKAASSSAPSDEVGFVATDANASSYKTSDSFASANALTVKALYSDGTDKVLTNEYNYAIKNSSNATIDPNEPFTNAGTYTLIISYKNYISQNIILTVTGSTFRPITEIAIDDVSGTFDTSDKLSDYIASESWSAIVCYADGDLDQIYFDDFSDNFLSLALTNPSGITHDVDTVFGVEGTWKVRVSYTANPTIYDETTFDVSIVPVATITLDHSSETIFVDDTIQLAVSTIGPNNATHKEYTWSSTDTSVATVTENGLVTGKAKGTCQIRATANDGSAVYGQCDIIVKENTSTKYTFTSKEWNATPANWTSGQDGNGYLNNGVQVTGSATGANATSPKSFNNVNKVIVGYCTNSKSGAGKITIKVGSTSVASKDVSTSGGTTKRDMEFIPSSPLSGKVTITVTCSDNSIYICSCDIYTGEGVYPTDISLSSSSTNIGIGETTSINVSCTPENADIKNFTWSSSNSDVATVNNSGIVTGIAAGSATITCKAASSTTTYITKTINITVSVVAVTGVTISPTSATINVGGSTTLSATITPSNATNQNVTFSSSDTNVATVNNSGVVTGVAPGSVIITVKTADGNKTATSTITVSASGLAKTKIQQTYKDYCTNHWYDCDSTPTTANPKILIIPVWFNNSQNYISSSKKENVRSDIQTAYLGSNAETGWRSVKTYYEELSCGETSLTGTVSEWYEPNISSYEVTDITSTTTLATNATAWYFNNHGSDTRTNYDTDGNGYLDGVILIYAAPDHSQLEGNDNLWAYCYWAQKRNKNKTSPNINAFFWASYDFMYDSSDASSRSGSSYGSGDTSYCTVDAHTFIHEMGHMFGIDDYYDYSYNYKPAGAFSMQDYNVGSHDPYSVMAWGWADPYIPTESCTIDLHSFQSTRELILLTPEWNSYDSPFDEYLLLELYTPTGLNKFDCDHKYYGSPQGPNATGIRLWHVDSRLGYLSGDYIYLWTANAKRSNIGLATSNTYETGDNGGSLFSETADDEYFDFNILQLIGNDKSRGYRPTTSLSSNDLFKNGSSFKMSDYASQFRLSGKLNQNVNLGWSFSVSITGSGDSAVARIVCTKA